MVVIKACQEDGQSIHSSVLTPPIPPPPPPPAPQSLPILSPSSQHSELANFNASGNSRISSPTSTTSGCVTSSSTSSTPITNQPSTSSSTGTTNGTNMTFFNAIDHHHHPEHQRRRTHSGSTISQMTARDSFPNENSSLIGRVQNKIQIAKDINECLLERINLNRNVSRDKMEGLNIKMGDFMSAGSSNELCTRPPTTLMNRESFIELKNLAAAASRQNNNNNDETLNIVDSQQNIKNVIMNTNAATSAEHGHDPNLDPIDGIVALLSAIYCKILVVIGLCFPIAEVISHRIPISWYEGFYLYLYMGSILFLIFVYIFLLNRKRKPFARFRRSISAIVENRSSGSSKNNNKNSNPSNHNCNNEFDTVNSSSLDNGEHGDYEFDPAQQQAQCGSFYLRVGAVAFGVGSMIYSGLEFGQFFELESKEHCYSFIYGFTPSSHMIFTFIQLYFIFMNSRVLIARHKLIARFGLMHMIATNICVWLHVLIQETKHQIMVMVQMNGTAGEMIGSDLTNAWDHVDDVVEEMSEDYLDSVASYPVFHRTVQHKSNQSPTIMVSTTTASNAFEHLNRAARSLNDHPIITTGHCRRSNIIGELVTDASQFLFPCTIEYSLICAAILYIMWKNISQISEKHRLITNKYCKLAHFSKQTSFVHHRHHYQVDCAKAHKGLFTGIFLMVICIISLILFFVFIKKHQYRNLAVLQAHIVELVIYCITAIASLIALFQVRELNYNRSRGVELDNILLIIAQSGLCIFTMFSIIGAQFINQLQNTRLVLINAFACLIQALLQSIFILDASKRKASTIDQVRRKPGREMVTFLLVCNFSMWAINTLETRRADSNPVQMSFYGFWAWTIITHVTTPLTIFYRFHSTVSLCEIWKSTYKIKSEYLA